MLHKSLVLVAVTILFSACERGKDDSTSRNTSGGVNGAAKPQLPGDPPTGSDKPEQCDALKSVWDISEENSSICTRKSVSACGGSNDHIQPKCSDGSISKFRLIQNCQDKKARPTKIYGSKPGSAPCQPIQVDACDVLSFKPFYKLDDCTKHHSTTGLDVLPVD
jgi:hypothetical protein